MTTETINRMAAGSAPTDEWAGYCDELADRAAAASRSLRTVPGVRRDEALRRLAQRLLDARAALREANEKDLAAGREMGLGAAMLERLTLNEKRIEAMADSVRQIADQIDPVGRVIEGYIRPNGLRLAKVRVPIGVILFIYESRPNVTTDAAALCLKSGNAVILRGGKEAVHSNTLVTALVREALTESGMPEHAVQLVGTTDRAVVGRLLQMEGRIDLCIPRGGESLIRAVVEQARIPVIKHYQGNCHVYVDADCDDRMAIDICVNAKTQRPSVCNAVETILVHRAAADRGLLKLIADALTERGVELRGDADVCRTLAAARPASEDDWKTEFLDLIVAVKVVDSLDDAVDHIARYGSQHTDAIVTRDIDAADRFVQRVDSANVLVNCSTRFSDGGEYGLGAEIGISTDKLHARGPMGAADLTTYKWVAHGSGQIRT